MTMRVFVRNADATRRARLRTVDFSPADSSVMRTADLAELAPGEEREVWIHAGREIVVSETP